MKKIMLVCAAMVAMVFGASAQNNKVVKVSGILADSIDHSVLPFSNVMIYRDGKIAYGTETDLDGSFHADILDGSYTIVFSPIGFHKKSMNLKVVNDTHFDTIFLSRATLDCELPIIISKDSALIYKNEK